MKIDAVASGGNAGSGGGYDYDNDKYRYSGSGGGGAGATLKYSGNELSVSIIDGNVTLTSSEGDTIVLNKGDTGDNYTSGSTGNGGTGGTKIVTNNNNSFTNIIIASGNAGNPPKLGEGFGNSAIPPAGGTAGITYSVYGIGKDGTTGTPSTAPTNQSVMVIYVTET